MIPGRESDKEKAAKNGFTLIELLVVIAIIAILMAMIFPSIGNVRTIADQITCTNKIRDLGVANARHMADYNGFVMPHIFFRQNGNPVGWHSNPAIMSYIGMQTGGWVSPVQICPRASLAHATFDGQHVRFWWAYGYNGYIQKDHYTTPWPSIAGPWEARQLSFQISELASPSSVLAFADGTDWNLASVGVQLHLGEVYPPYALTQFRHQRRINVAHFDNSVRSYSYEEALREELWANNTLPLRARPWPRYFQ